MDEGNSMSQKKNRSNNRKAICILYISIMVGASIVFSVQAMDERKSGLSAIVQNMLLGTLYATSAGILFSMAVFFFLSRSQTFEAAQKSVGPIPFIVKYSGCGEPVNLYLRLGLTMFAVMSISQNSVRLYQISKDPLQKWPDFYRSAFQMMLIICQSLFILIYHRIVILHNHELFGASLMHVLSTNLCMWADVTVDKIRSTLHLDDYELNGGGNHSYVPTSPEIKKLSFYLLPAVSEYCLLSAALIYEITTRIGQPSYIELEEEDEEKEESKRKQLRKWFAKIKSGYWSPLSLVFIVVVLTIVTGVSPKYSYPPNWKCAVLFSEEMLLNCLGFAVSLVAFLNIRRLKFTTAPRHNAIDEALLYIAFFFAVSYIFADIALSGYLKRTSHFKNQQEELLMGRIALDILELLEVILQTYLIQDCFSRCSDKEIHKNLKPGQKMIGILLGINLATWVSKSFQLKEADIVYSMHGDAVYGWVPIAMAMPIYLFYRYHCTVCLSQSFTMLYEDETRRFEVLWRQNPIYLANLISNTNLAFCDNCHLHANEESESNSNWRRGSELQPKLSIQSGPKEGIYARRPSFFHSQTLAVPMEIDPYNSSNLDQLRHKLSMPCTQKKTSLSSLSRLSTASGNRSQEQFNSTTGLQAFEWQGDSEIIASDHKLHNSRFVNQTGHSDDMIYGSHPAQKSPDSGQLKQQAMPKLQMTQPPNVFVNSASIDGSTGKRRQTLVNLEAAKLRFLAAESLHKRVLNRTHNIPAAELKKKANKNVHADAKETQNTKTPDEKENHYAGQKSKKKMHGFSGSSKKLHKNEENLIQETPREGGGSSTETVILDPTVRFANKQRHNDHMLTPVPEDAQSIRTSEFSYNAAMGSTLLTEQLQREEDKTTTSSILQQESPQRKSGPSSFESLDQLESEVDTTSDEDEKKI